jgi:hypothetical protein
MAGPAILGITINTMEVNYNGYPVYKGLQLPLEFMAIRGRFIVFAAVTFGTSFLGFILGYLIAGLLTAFLIMSISAGIGLGTIFLKQRKGLHSKKRCRGIYVYTSLFEH